MVKLTIDNRKIEVEEGTTLLEAAQKLGIEIPTLCHHQALKPYGACRVCLVEVIKGSRPGLVASCTYPAEEGLIAKTDTERVKRARRLSIELLLARCPTSEKVRELALELGVK
ncbi:(2Fe-2S)-binding protein, partial [bacterium]|nr:(2Fe-2S)-binding protein [bacterium]